MGLERETKKKKKKRREQNIIKLPGWRLGENVGRLTPYGHEPVVCVGLGVGSSEGWGLPGVGRDVGSSVGARSMVGFELPGVGLAVSSSVGAAGISVARGEEGNK